MNFKQLSQIWATGFAMFSMFFGAGNVVFPLFLGQAAGDLNFYATSGLILTAVLIPLMGLIAAMLYEGDYDRFFDRIGKWPGYIAILATMVLIGPGGATPRTITLSYSTIDAFFPGMGVWMFSFIACLIIFAFTYKQNKILDILGYVLTPFLLICLLLIIIKGLFFAPGELLPPPEGTALSFFSSGLMTGYNTMDLLATYFFSHIVLLCLKNEVDPSIANDKKKLLSMSLKSSLIAVFLLGTIYAGFSYVAAYHSNSLIGIDSDKLLGVLAVNILGPSAAIIACGAVALACLTTAIALVSVFAEFLQKDVFMDRVGYIPCLLITLVSTFFISTLEFKGIAVFLEPILQIWYPALIVLSLCNLLHKLTGFMPVKVPVYGTFAASIAWHLYS
jgi:LIVCS family branched-chain amino acid:cation transporter